jgi:hypothetical protein
MPNLIGTTAFYRSRETAFKMTWPGEVTAVNGVLHTINNPSLREWFVNTQLSQDPEIKKAFVESMNTMLKKKEPSFNQQLNDTQINDLLL